MDIQKFRQLSKPSKYAIVGVLVLLGGLMVTVNLSLQRQENRSRAATTGVVVSDSNTQVLNGTTWQPTVKAYVYGGTIPSGAMPIWKTASVSQSEAIYGTSTLTFKRIFTMPSSGTGTLSIAVDDQFIVSLNGTTVGSVGTVTSAGALDPSSTLSAANGKSYPVNLQSGQNELIIKARSRTGVSNDTSSTNPAWIAYSLSYTYTQPTNTPVPTNTPTPTLLPTATLTPTGVPPTPTKTPTPTLIAATTVPSLTNTPVPPTPTNTPIPTGVPTNTPAPTSTPVPGATKFALNLLLHGLGKGGDSVNPNGTGNFNLLRPQRNATIEVYDNQNQLVLTKQGAVNFDNGAGAFKGVIDMGTNLANGVYIIKVKLPQYLRTNVPGIQTIVAGSTNQIATTTFITGDINGDNTINILDYNILMGCYSDFLPPVSCSSTNQPLADLTDDGEVNQFDYNLFLRELTSRGGQ